MALFAKNLGGIGIDVSDQSIECAQVRLPSGTGPAEVHGVSRVPLPAGVIHDGRLQRAPDFQEALRKALVKPMRGQLDSRQAILSVPEHQCYHHVFKLDVIGDQRLPHTVVEERLAAAVPFPVADMLWDWKIIDSTLNSLLVYAAAVPKEVIESYRQSLQLVGLALRVAEPQVISAGRGLWSNTSDEPFVFIDIGAFETAISTIDRFGIHQSSIVTVGTQHIINEFIQVMNLNQSTAERVLYTIGLRNLKHPKISAIHDIVRKNIRPLYEEIQQHLVYYVSRHPDAAIIGKFMIIGGGSMIPGVVEVLAQSLRLQAMPVGGADVYKPVLSPGEFALFANALGAASRRLEDHDDEVNVLLTRRLFEKKKDRPAAAFWKRLVGGKKRTTV